MRVLFASVVAFAFSYALTACGPAMCSPANCGGCCADGFTCVFGSTPGNCGSFGNPCQSCGSGICTSTDGGFACG